MPTSETGLIVFFDEARRNAVIGDRVDGPSPFSDALSVPDWNMGELSVSLLSFTENRLDYIALARRGKQVVTSKRRVEFSSIVSLDGLPISEVEARLGTRLRNFFIRASRGTGGLLPSATWLAAIGAIIEMRPEKASEVERLRSLCRYSRYRIIGDSANLMVQERDALGVSLDIFSGSNKLRDRVLGEWAPREESIASVDESGMTASLAARPSGSSFLRGIPGRYLQEEAAIQHDLFNWPGMSPLHEAGVSVFQSGDRRLEVMYANRNSLERTLGVDLIYYSENYEMFVLVQYKMMREEGEEFVYRPDGQLAAEIDRMNGLYRSSGRGPIRSHQEFRLSDDGFMIKLVPQLGLKPASGELIKGMYVTREYMEFLLGPDGPRGSQGGVNITFDNSPRYLTNSEFISSVRSGWIGTRGAQSDTICELVRSFYETGRAVMVAKESTLAIAAS